jgi:hypothetical protein
MTQIIQIHPDDNVAVVPAEVIAGVDLEQQNGDSIIASSDIPRNHKVALADLNSGASVVKYGVHIGVATQPIARGEHVHIHNMNLDETTED